jgi:hypothetical protein
MFQYIKSFVYSAPVSKHTNKIVISNSIKEIHNELINILDFPILVCDDGHVAKYTRFSHYWTITKDTLKHEFWTGRGFVSEDNYPITTYHISPCKNAMSGSNINISIKEIQNKLINLLDFPVLYVCIQKDNVYYYSLNKTENSIKKVYSHNWKINNYTLKDEFLIYSDLTGKHDVCYSMSYPISPCKNVKSSSNISINIREIHDKLINLLKFPVLQHDNGYNSGNKEYYMYIYSLAKNERPGIHFYSHFWTISKENLIQEFLVGDKHGSRAVYPRIYYNLDLSINSSLAYNALSFPNVTHMDITFTIDKKPLSCYIIDKYILKELTMEELKLYILNKYKEKYIDKKSEHYFDLQRLNDTVIVSFSFRHFNSSDIMEIYKVNDELFAEIKTYLENLFSNYEKTSWYNIGLEESNQKYSKYVADLLSF